MSNRDDRMSSSSTSNRVPVWVRLVPSFLGPKDLQTRPRNPRARPELLNYCIRAPGWGTEGFLYLL